MTEPRTEPRTAPKSAAKSKGDLPGALNNPDTMVLILPYLARGLRATIIEDNTSDQGELRRNLHRLVQRFIAESAAYAGPPEKIDPAFDPLADLPI